MLTIGQLASYAGVTVRAVRHYHAKGLLPEPERDHSNYRRYDAQAVVRLIRIRTLAEAGVPLSRVGELVAAGPQEFATAIREIDRRLEAEVRERQRHRERVAQLASGDSLALPAEAAGYLQRMRELGFGDRAIEIERDSWILVAARAPDQVPALMAAKRGQIEDPGVRQHYLSIETMFDTEADDPRLPELADRVIEFVEALGAQAEQALQDPAAEEDWLTPDLVDLLDAVFVQSFPAAPRLLELLEARGYVGWTDIRRVDGPVA